MGRSKLYAMVTLGTFFPPSLTVSMRICSTRASINSLLVFGSAWDASFVGAYLERCLGEVDAGDKAALRRVAEIFLRLA